MTTTKYPDNVTVVTSYDAFDRPIKVLDNRLVMNVSGNDRASYFVYDSLGNLIKELGPVMRSGANGGYTDARRPYTEYIYDDLGRQTITRQMVNGSDIVSPSSMAMPSGAEVAETETFYDTYDRPYRVDDPLEYPGRTHMENFVLT